MSKVLLDHVPPRSPVKPRTAPPAPPRPQRSRVEAGVLGLVIGGILLFAAGFAALFPETSRSPMFWPSYSDTARVFEARYPRGWVVEETAHGVIFREPGDGPDAGMVFGVTRLAFEGTSVEELAAHRMQEVADLGAAEAVRGGWPEVGDRPTSAIRELTWGDGRVTTRLFVQTGDGTYVTITAMAPPGRFDSATFSTFLDTFAFAGPDVAAIDDRVGQSRP